jgi:hypothetical protein
MLGSYIWLGVGQASQRFIAFGRQQQALQIAAKFIALIALPEQVIEVPGIGFQWLGSSRDSSSFGHLTFPSPFIVLSPTYCQQSSATAVFTKIEPPHSSAFLSNESARPGNLRVMRLQSLLSDAYNNRMRVLFF